MKGNTISTKGIHEEHEGKKSYPRRATRGLEKAQEGSAKGREGRKDFHEVSVNGEPFAKFASRWDLLPGRVVIPGSAGVPPAQDLAGSWRLASQGWSVHLPTGAGAAPLQECGRDARAPRGKPMAGQVQIRILQKARGQKINPRRDSKGLEKTRKGSVKGHEERH